MGWVRDVAMRILPHIHPAISPILRAYWARRHPASRRVYDVGEEHAEIFTSIYERNFWGAGESRSGPGSTLSSTRAIRRLLPIILRDIGARTFLDAPCGDFNWMKTVDMNGVIYTGGDIVQSLILLLQASHAEPTRRFQILDIVNDPVPTVDLWMCRECLMHLPTKDVVSVLRNFHRSETRYFLTTSFDLTTINEDLPSPGFRPLNLRIDPINLPEPILRFDDFVAPAQPRIMGLWSREQVGSALRSASTG